MNAMAHKLAGLALLFCLVAAPAFIGAGKVHGAWEADWKRTIEAAKKEGRVTVHTLSNLRYVEVETAERMSMEPVLNLYAAALAEAEKKKKK